MPIPPVLVWIAGAVIVGAIAASAGDDEADQDSSPRMKRPKKKQRSKKDRRMTKKRLFISFDFDHDAGAKTMLAGQAKLPDSPFDFTDASLKEHLTGDWKEKIKKRMDNVDAVAVLCGESTHTAKGVAAELEIAREKKKPYFLLAAYSDKPCAVPTSALSSDKIYSWNWDNLKNLLAGHR